MKIKTFLLAVALLFTLCFIPETQALAQQASDSATIKPKLIEIAARPVFSLPIDCRLGETCHILNYLDFSPEDGKAQDPACAPRTYDNHRGTDIAVLDGKAMETGVAVIAPLAGTVLKIRDGEEDKWHSTEELDIIRQERKECGNAIMIDHGQGLQTIYCHLKKGSITVKPKQEVKVGDVMGQVGLSGLTEFPHLHFGILQNDKIIDPFTGKSNTHSCGGELSGSLWAKDVQVKYEPFIIHSSGFSNTIPTLEQIEQNSTDQPTIAIASSALVYWANFWGVEEGDLITLELKDPNGKVFADTTVIQPKTRAQQFYYVGKKITDTPLAAGAYTGTATLTRKRTGQTELKDSKVKALLISP